MKKKKSSVQTPNSLWGGRFAKGPAAIMAEINASIGFDRHLYRQDIAGSRAHLAMLVEQGIVSPADGKKILKGLDQVEVEIAAGKMQFKPTLEDIHMHVEARLSELIGDPAGRLHTARSRNDQVALDVHLYVRDQIDHITYALKQLLAAFLDRAEEEAATVLPGFTHLQSAQPVTFGHHLMAYVEMLERDLERFENVRHSTNESPLGAAALAGTSFPIDRHMTAKALGFRGPMRNSMDAVASRDFAAEFLAAGAILSVHLSRFAEEIVLWMSDAFGYIRLSDAFTTGSSIMPQKKNPDAAELVRGKTGRMIGHLNAMLVTLKGLPLTYGKDMQEDKEPLIDAASTLALTISATTGMVRDMTVNRDRMRKATEVGHITATDLADWLVRTLGLPFRRAHHITGALVKKADALGCQLAAMPLSEMRAVEPGITGEVYKVLTVDRSVASRTSFGGTAPKRVREAVKAARKRLKL